MLDTSLFSPNRVTKLVSSTSELLKQEALEDVYPWIAKIKKDVGTHCPVFLLTHHSHPRHSWLRFLSEVGMAGQLCPYVKVKVVLSLLGTSEGVENLA